MDDIFEKLKGEDVGNNWEVYSTIIEDILRENDIKDYILKEIGKGNIKYESLKDIILNNCNHYNGLKEDYRKGVLRFYFIPAIRRIVCAAERDRQRNPDYILGDAPITTRSNDLFPE